MRWTRDEITQRSRGRLRDALLDPAAVFNSPRDVERDPLLNSEEKLAILISWEEDARELAVAEDENMAGGEPNRLSEAVAARVRLAELGEKSETPPQERMTADSAQQPVRWFTQPVREIVHADHDMDEATLRLSLQDHPILPVSDGDEIVGVVARTELGEAAEAKAGGARRLTARVMMTANFAFCYLDDDVTTARALMDKHGCDHLLVVDSERVVVGTLERHDLPPASKRAVRARQKQAGVTEPREEHAQAVATTIQPGGLDVYAERPIIKKPQT